MERRNGRKAEEGRMRITLPYLKWPLRMLLYFLTLLSAGLSLAIVVFYSFHKIIDITIFVAAGCCLALSCCYLYQDLRYGVREKIKPGIEANSFTRRVTSDYRYRTVLFTHSALTVNLLFALSNGVFGIVYHSAWFGALSGYYLVLSVMRFIAIRYERKHRCTEQSQAVKRKELYTFRNSGILFIILTLALFISVIQMVFYGQVKNYPGILIFAYAAYTFIKIGIAVFHLFKVGRMNSPLLRMIRNIGYADALVSLVSLQTAMFVAFGDETDTRTMNLLTGGVVCLMILLMGVYMIRFAEKQLAQME